MWQFFIVFYFIFGTTSALSRRVLAQKLGENNRLINSLFFLFFLLPAIIILSFFFPHNLNIGLLNLTLLFFGGIIWPLFYIAAFNANRQVDVGIYMIISNLSPLFTLAVAIPFLHENLSILQNFGVGLLILSGVLAATSQINKQHRASLNGISMCLLSTAIAGIAIAYESFMLHRVDFGTYLLLGWGSQIIWSLILTGKELRKLPALFNKDPQTKKTLITWGTSHVLESVTFVLALKISGSASLFSSATVFLSVVVLITAYFFLNERKHMIHKWLAAGIGIAGLLIIAK